MKAPVESIKLSDFEYELPDSKIAKHPLEDRSSSKLLVYKKGKVYHNQFKSIEQEIGKDNTIFFNNTKVIPARLHFKKETGALIEIFLLEPVNPTNEVAQAMLVKNSCEWRCMIGNLKRWKEGQELHLCLDISKGQVNLKAEIHDRSNQTVRFTWDEDLPFVDIVSAAGKIPLPPYIDREVEENDKERYQTVYSLEDGAVAAPTAGLHFTDEIISQIKSSGNEIDYLTLHVSAGTFQPIKVDNAADHNMHSEQIAITLNNLETILRSKHIIAVGTTSMRTLESLYWYGVKLMKTDNDSFNIEKFAPYQYESHQLPELKESIEAVKSHMLNKGLKTITGFTEIFIFPGYTFQVCQGLITNFHMSGSTLILLVAAFIGEDWRNVYQEALDREYRFLSYGDSSILIP